MSKRKKHRRTSVRSGLVSNSTKSSEERSVLKLGAPILILILGVIGFGAFWNFGLSSKGKSSSSTASVQPVSTPEYAAAKPAKEYVYSGGKLVAVSEPTNPAPNDLAIWRLSGGTGTWWVMGQDGSTTTQAFGSTDDKPAPGDYDGDGKTDFCIFRPSEGNWYFLGSASNNTLSVYGFGVTGDKPVPADFDGDGKTDLAVYRASNHTWYVSRIAQGFFGQWTFGVDYDEPVPGDYDGDGKADIAMWRSSNATWYVWQTSDNAWNVQQWGASGDKPVQGDYDGDGKTDLAVWQSGNGWYIRKSSTNSAASPTVGWGFQSSDTAVQGDYDADGKTDIAVWRSSNGTWYILQSRDGTRIQPWGQSGDIPVPAPYRR